VATYGVVILFDYLINQSIHQLYFKLHFLHRFTLYNLHDNLYAIIEDNVIFLPIIFLPKKWPYYLCK